jgi:hypothetical protein
MTERDLARAANASTQVQYGPQQQALSQQLQTSQQAERDTGSYYDQYLQRLAQNQRDIENIQRGVQAGLQGIAGGITGLAGQTLQGIQQPANADAAARGAQAGNLTQMAYNDAAQRQALVGSFQAQQQLVGATEQEQAAGMANIVGPQQKLAAQDVARQRTGKVQGDITALAGQRGAYNEQYRAEQRAAEGKNVLAQSIATGKTAVDLAKIKADADKARAGRRVDYTKIRAAATQKQADREAKAAAAAAKASEPNKYGVPADQWAKWSTSHRQRVINASGSGTSMSKKEADAFQAKFGVKPQATAAIARGRDTVATVQDIINRQNLPKTSANRSKLYSALVSGQAADKAKKVAGIAKHNPLWTDVALDLWQHGGITGSTAHRLHLAGYSVKTLGLKNAPTTTQRNTAAYGPSSPQPQQHY